MTEEPKPGQQQPQKPPPEPISAAKPVSGPAPSMSAPTTSAVESKPKIIVPAAPAGAVHPAQAPEKAQAVKESVIKVFFDHLLHVPEEVLQAIESAFKKVL